MGGEGGDDGGDDQDQEVPVGSVCRSPILVGRTSVSSVVGVGRTSRHGSPVRVPWLRRQSHPACSRRPSYLVEAVLPWDSRAHSHRPSKEATRVLLAGPQAGGWGYRGHGPCVWPW